MPTFDLTIRGARYHVEIPDPAANPLTVIVDGEPFAVEFGGITSPSAERVSGLEPEGTQTLPPPAPPPASPPIALPSPTRVNVALPVRPAGSMIGSEVTAPMPGAILSIAVTVGDVVEPGQLLCVLEAMKMKNPIRASQGGKVTQVNVAEGQNVSFGDLLVSLA